MTEFDYDHDDCTTIRVRLPLALDVWGSIVSAVAVMYPNGHMYAPFGRDTELHVPKGDRPRKLSKRELAKAKHDLPDDDSMDASVNSFSNDGDGINMAIGLSTEEAWRELAAWAGVVLLAAEAVNYAEMPVKYPDPDTGEMFEYTVCAARSKGQTPHQLRQQADRKLANVLLLHEPTATGQCPECRVASPCSTVERAQ